MASTYWDTVGVLLTDSLSFCLALLEGMLVLELGTHIDGWSTDDLMEVFVLILVMLMRVKLCECCEDR